MFPVPMNTWAGVLARTVSLLRSSGSPQASRGCQGLYTGTSQLCCPGLGSTNRALVPSGVRSTVTQMGRGKPLPVCKQMMDCSICPDVLVPLGRNQSIHSITQLCDISPHKGPSEAVGFGVMTLNVVRINLPRVPGE